MTWNRFPANFARCSKDWKWTIADEQWIHVQHQIRRWRSILLPFVGFFTLRMKNHIVRTGALLSALLTMFCQAAAAATPVVSALLQDPSTDPAIHSMRIVLDRDSVPAGKIRFHAANQSKEQVHELIVVRIKPGQTKLPYDKKKTEVEEKHIQHLGEIADLKPGASGSMILNLSPGSYLLICNQPGHYAAGMATPLTVTK